MAAANTVTDSIPSRFVELEGQNVADFIRENESINTVRKTKYDMALFNSFLQTKFEMRELLDLPAEELCQYICQFIIEVRQKNGDDYEPNSLRSMVASIERHLKLHNYGAGSIFNDAAFELVRKTLKSKQKELKGRGKGGYPNAARSLTDEERAIMFEKGQLGMTNPVSLINTIWWNNAVHFGMRGGKEHRDMKWGDVTLVEAPLKSYIVYQERQTKTRQGDQPRNTRIIPPKQFSTSCDPEDKYDPVSVYKRYASLRPKNMLQDDAPFYLGTNFTKSGQYDTKSWYKSQPMGVNKLNNIMKDMFRNAGLKVPGDRNVSNHSARKTMIQTLKDAKVPDTNIQQISGHANLQSLNNYNEMNLNAQEEVSNILAGYPGRKAIVPVSDHCESPFQEQSITYRNYPDRRFANYACSPKSSPIPVEIHSESSPSLPSAASVSVIDILSDRSNLPYTSSGTATVDITSNTSNENRSLCNLQQPAALFANASISGGTFNTYVYKMSSDKPLKRRRVAVIASDSDSD